MATVEGRPAQYGVTLRQLRELMESRGAEGLAKINALGGPQEICKKLYTSPTDGPYQFIIILFTNTIHPNRDSLTYLSIDIIVVN
ncbi:hypothetical protein HF086_008599 [Spodoptera exigua]|uniref:Uncharacterized protein n=1 Tax=Spodoptera exigua TaxID=7107 RepID=A0A922S9Q5_SPOEX|nr:hypothetical protein HF086_008599 [Spodoptera exigua]